MVGAGLGPPLLFVARLVFRFLELRVLCFFSRACIMRACDCCCFTLSLGGFVMAKGDVARSATVVLTEALAELDKLLDAVKRAKREVRLAEERLVAESQHMPLV